MKELLGINILRKEGRILRGIVLRKPIAADEKADRQKERKKEKNESADHWLHEGLSFVFFYRIA